MTPDEAKAAMEKIFNMHDIEEAHCRADDLLCDILRELGYGDAVDVFENAYKWYA